nr:hypothetical protein [Tanacetum cinerariifolium]
MKELQQFQERLKEIKEECNTNIQRLKRNIEDINPESTRWNIKALQVLFRKAFNSFKQEFVRFIDNLELQLDTEEFHECNFKKCLTELKKQFEKFLADASDCKNEERTLQEILNKKHYVFNTQGFKDLIIRYLNGIKKGIDARVTHEEVLRLKERDVNERGKKERHVIELEMLKLGKMTQKGECNNTRNAQREKQSKNKVNERTMQTHEGMISKDASEIDNNVARASHDKDNMNESYIEIKNKEEIERFSKESKDGDKFCDDVVKVKEK